RGDDSALHALVVSGFGRDGVLLASSDDLVNCSKSMQNGRAGIGVTTTVKRNRIVATLLTGNLGLPIDRADDGVADVDAPSIVQAVPSGQTLGVTGRVDATGGATRVEFFSSATCTTLGAGEATTYLGGVDVAAADIDGNGVFNVGNVAQPPDGSFLTMTATASDGTTQELSSCVPVGADNDSWPRALDISGRTSPTTGFV